MRVKFKKVHSKAVLPSYANPGDAGLDLTAVTKSAPDKDGNITYGTGIAVEIPRGYVGLLFSRSSIYKKNLFQRNCVGVIDSGFRGEIKMIFGQMYSPPFDPYQTNFHYSLGDRIGQLVIIQAPNIEVEEVIDLSQTKRAENGFGSTGN